jgi:hypothetical protein
MDEIFISYSRGDSQFVDGLIRDLERKGIHVWVDREDIEGGTAWRAAISDAIRQCRAFLIVLSPNSTRSKNVSRELSLAESHDRMIIPIIYQDCDIPSGMEYQLAELQWINLNNLTYEVALDRLVRALAKSAGTGGEASPQHIEKRRHDTARLRQILESSEAPPPPGSSVQAERPSVKSATGGDGLKSKLAIVAAACAVLLLVGGYAFYRGSSSGQTATTQTSGTPVSTPNDSGASSQPTPRSLDTERANTERPQRATEPSAPPPTPAPTAPPSLTKPILGTTRGNKYFPPDCDLYKGVQAAYRVEFKSTAEAERAGFTLHEKCRLPAPDLTKPIIGNTSLKLYHFPHCPGYGKQREEFRVVFKSEAEAQRAGYQKATNCN